MTTENPMLTMIREVCSLGRAEFTRPTTASGDDSAQRTLVAGLEALDPEGNASDISLSLDLLAPRAPYFDQLVLDTIPSGIPQVVNIGAGYDDRALRFRNDGTSFFELDLPAIVADKIQRLSTIPGDKSGLRIAPIDLAVDDIADVLATMGHDAALPTLFLAEHVALFLEPQHVTRLLEGIARRAAPGSRFALTAETHPDGLDSQTVVNTVDSVMFGGVGPLHTIQTETEWRNLLSEAGWIIDDTNNASIDHFPFPLAGRDIQIETRIISTDFRAPSTRLEVE